MENKLDVEDLLKILDSYKLQLEAKDSAYLQLLQKFEHYQATVEELCMELKNTEAEKDAYVDESRESRNRVEELESKVKEMDDQLSKTEKLKEQLSHALNELGAKQGEMLVVETKLASAKDGLVKALSRSELSETAASIQKERAEDLLKHVMELNEAVLALKIEVVEAEKEKCMVLSEKDDEIKHAKEIADMALEQVEKMRNEMEMANELHSSCQLSASNGSNDLKQLKADFEDKEQENTDKDSCIKLLESELNRVKLELTNENDQVSSLKSDVLRLTEELVKVKAEKNAIKERENAAQVEIALLKVELHEGRSKVAAAEAAESRAENLKSGFEVSAQQLAVEAEEARHNKNMMLKQGEMVAEESGSLALVVVPNGNYSHSEKIHQTNNSIGRNVTIVCKEYESLITRSHKTTQSLSRYSNQLTRNDSMSEVERLMLELEAAMAKMGQLRNRAEQAVTRAEVAEKAKTTLEDQIKRWREQRKKRKATIAALREECSSRASYNASYSYSMPSNDTTPKCYTPLFKILNMKF